MLTMEDCIELCELSEDEVLAIAEHEGIPEVAAIEMGNYLVHTPDGQKRIRRMMREDIAAAQAAGDMKHVLVLKHVLKHFIACHPCHDGS